MSDKFWKLICQIGSRMDRHSDGVATPAGEEPALFFEGWMREVSIFGGLQVRRDDFTSNEPHFLEVLIQDEGKNGLRIGRL